MIIIKKILVIFLIFPVLFLGGCELFKSKTYLKDVVPSYEEFDKAVIFNPINNEEYVLNEEEYNDIVLLIDKFYDFEVSHIDIFEGADEPQNEKMNYVSTQNDPTKPMPSPPSGRYVLYLFNLKTNTHLYFAYDTVFEVFDSASHMYYHIKLNQNSHTSILNFGIYIANLYESKFNEILLSDIFKSLEYLDSSNVESIKEEYESSGASPLIPFDTNVYTSPEKIDEYLSKLKNYRLKYSSLEMYVPGGSATYLTISGKNDEYYKIKFYNKYLIYNGYFCEILNDLVDITPDEYYQHFLFGTLEGSIIVGGIEITTAKVDFNELKVREITYTPFIKSSPTPLLTFRTKHGDILVMNEEMIEIDGRIFAVVEGTEQIIKLIDLLEESKINYVKDPIEIDEETFNQLENKYPSEDTCSKAVDSKEIAFLYNSIIDLNDLFVKDGGTFDELFGTSSNLSDEEFANTYAILRLVRTCPPSDDFKNVSFSNFFVLNNDLYYTCTYNCSSTGAYDAAIVLYVDYFLVPKRFANNFVYNSYTIFKTYENSVFTDKSFIYIEYHDIPYIINAYKKSSFYVDFGNYDVIFKKTLGTYNKANVLLLGVKGFESEEIVSTIIGDYEFKHSKTENLVIYYDANIISLNDAYNNKIISDDDLKVIYNYYNR